MKRTTETARLRREVFGGMGRARIVWVVSLAVLVCLLSSVLFFFLNENRGRTYALLRESMRPGYLAPRTVVSDASYRLVDEEASREACEAARAAVPPVFVRDVASTLRSLSAARAFAEALTLPKDAFMEGAFALAEPQLAYQAWDLLSSDPELFGGLAVQLAEDVLDKGLWDAEALEKAAGGFDAVYVLPRADAAAEDAVLVPKESLQTNAAAAKAVADALEGLASGREAVLAKVVLALAAPNMEPSQILTDELRGRIDPGDHLAVHLLVPGQIIIEENTIVTEEEARILELLAAAAVPAPKGKIAGSLLLMLVISAICVLLFDFLASDGLHKFEFFLVLLVGSLLSLTASFFFHRLARSLSLATTAVLMPVFAVPLLVSLLSGKKGLGAVASALLSAAVCMMPGAGPATFFLCFLSSASCLFLITYLDKRMDLLLQWLATLLLGLFYLFVWFLLERTSLEGFALAALCEALNLVASFVVVSAALPLLENLFNIPTQFRLKELSDPHSPLLRRLGQEAPGTFNHSMEVAEIAETAARAIGANALLTKVGAMYHDIGKIDHAEYFTENISLLGNSPEAKSHENINRNLAVAIIKSHVKLGVEKGRQLGLPQEVLDIIGNHHGNDVVTYFFNEAAKLHQEDPEEHDEPRMEEYCYLGDPPRTPEQAIVMLADCSEAACRSIVKPTPNKIEKTVTMILIKKIVNKQLNDCRLTITDLNAVVKSLSVSLIGRHHCRVAYPEGKK